MALPVDARVALSSRIFARTRFFPDCTTRAEYLDLLFRAQIGFEFIQIFLIGSQDTLPVRRTDRGAATHSRGEAATNNPTAPDMVQGWIPTAPARRSSKRAIPRQNPLQTESY